MKSKKIALTIKVAIPILIIGGGIGVNKLLSVRAAEFLGNPVTVSEDSSQLTKDDTNLEVVDKKAYGNIEGFSKNLGFIGDDEALVSIGMNREEFYKKYPNEIGQDDQKIIQSSSEDRFGNIFRLKLSNLETKPLGIDVGSLYSSVVPNANKIIYSNNSNFTIYDLKNDSSVCKNASDIFGVEEIAGDWSKDGNYFISYYNGDFNLYNDKDKSLKKVKVQSDNNSISIRPQYYSEDGTDIYFMEKQNKGGDLRYEREGIFKINSSSGEIEEILVLPYRDTLSSDFSKENSIISNNYCVLDGGKRILLYAIIDGNEGVYIYDVDSNKFYNVVPHTVKSEDGLDSFQMWVSPDKTKIIYMSTSLENGKEKKDLYAAKINGNSLTSKICIYKDIKISGSISRAIQWSGDSKKILFFTGSEVIQRNNIEFNDKNEVNIITFK